MPNRILKESICTSDNLNNLTLEEEIFFYRLIVNCDDYGRMDGRPQIIRARCFPLRLDKVEDKEIEKWIESLTREKLIYLYKVNEQTYIQMTTWEQHQQIRAHKSKFPDPKDGEIFLISDDIRCNQMISDVTVIQSNPIQSESNPNTNTNTQKCFNEFWQAYPKKRSKGDAEKAWNKIKPDEQLHNRIMQSLEQAKTSADWTKKGGQFIPYPATWLNAKGWEDEYKEAHTNERQLSDKGGKRRLNHTDNRDWEKLLGID